MFSTNNSGGNCFEWANIFLSVFLISLLRCLYWTNAFPEPFAKMADTFSSESGACFHGFSLIFKRKKGNIDLILYCSFTDKWINLWFGVNQFQRRFQKQAHEIFETELMDHQQFLQFGKKLLTEHGRVIHFWNLR